MKIPTPPFFVEAPRMKIFHKGRPLTLSDTYLLGAGGEGKVYAIGKIAYKVYHEVSHALPLGKIQELSKIQDPRVINPIDPIQDERGNLCGYTMQRVSRYKTLCEVSTCAYRERHGIPMSTMVTIVGEIETTLPIIHAAGVVLGDLNDLNILVDPQTAQIAFIDLDSAQTPTYPLTAIMDSIRDPRTHPPYTPDQDWYALAVLAFRAFTGSGPYRGFHPSGLKELERKEKGLTCFDAGARLPASAYPISEIPTRYRDWLASTLAHEFRGAPGSFNAKPKNLPLSPPPAKDAMWGEPFPHPVPGTLRILPCGGEEVLITQTPKGWSATYQQTTQTVPRGSVFVNTPRDPFPLAVWEEKETLWGVSLNPARPNRVQIPLQVQAFHRSHTGGLICHEGGVLYRLDWSWNNTDPFFYTSRIGNCHPHLTLLFEGGALTTILGRHVLILTNSSGCIEYPLPHLDGKVIISVLGSPNGILLTYIENGSPSVELIRLVPKDHTTIQGAEGLAIVETPAVLVVQTTSHIHLFTKEGPSQERIFDPPVGLVGSIWAHAGRVCGTLHNLPHFLKTKKP